MDSIDDGRFVPEFAHVSEIYQRALRLTEKNPHIGASLGSDTKYSHKSNETNLEARISLYLKTEDGDILYPLVGVRPSFTTIDTLNKKIHITNKSFCCSETPDYRDYSYTIGEATSIIHKRGEIPILDILKIYDEAKKNVIDEFEGDFEIILNENHPK